MTIQPDSVHASNGQAIFARAPLKRAEITEEYFVQQEVSENPSTRQERPDGRIELELPYDGQKYFTRDARNDVAQGLAGRSRTDATAIIGHLLLRNYAKTSLGHTLLLDDRNGSVPIEVPVSSGRDIPERFDHLSADRQTCVSKYEFDPGSPDLVPANLEIELLDPDSLGLPPLSLRSDSGRPLGDVLEQVLRTERGQQYVKAVLSNIRQQARFEDELLLRIMVRLSVPVRAGSGELKPEVARVTIDWPTITSLRTIRLHLVDTRSRGAAYERPRDLEVRYNPVQKCIEWDHVPMIREPKSQGDDNVRHYRSLMMLLSIGQPGELYQQPALCTRAEIQIPGYLLSGLDARVYDATGYIRQRPPIRLTTKINATAELVLDDAFARREFSPNQHLFFDEIIPDESRVADIITALQGGGFDARQVWPGNSRPFYDQESTTLSWLLLAYRQQGPDDIVLWILVEGRNYGTERAIVMPGGGVTHTTRLQSGELRIFIRGTLARDSGEVTHEINALQKKLREQYSRVRQRR